MADDPLLIDTLRGILDPALTLLLALALAMGRPLPMLMILPVFTRLQLTGLVRNGVAMALSAPMVIPAYLALEGQPLDAGLLALLGKEVVVGIALGLVFSVPFYAAEAAGRYMDFQRGASEGSLVDPMTQAEESLTGSLLTMILLAMFYGAGGLGIVTGGLYASYGLWPLDNLMPSFSEATPELLFKILDGIAWLGLVLAGPVIIVLLLGDFLLGAISKFAPQINVFDTSMSLKGCLFALGLPLYAGFLLEYLGESLQPFEPVLNRLQEMLP